MYSVGGTAALPALGFPIRTSPDHSLVSGSPTLFAATHVLLRLLSPRHPSCALCSLVILFSFSLSSPMTKVQPGRLTGTPLSSLPSLSCAYSLVKERTFSISFLSGAVRDRTDDFQLAKLALSQLSYSPSTLEWAWIDLNYRPHAYQACALTS